MLKFIIISLLLLLSNISFAQVNTLKISNFFLGDSVESAKQKCFEIGYSPLVDTTMTGIIGITCKANKKQFKINPTKIYMIGYETKIVGLHVVFTNKKLYKKFVEEFEKSGILELTTTIVEKSRKETVWINKSQLWVGWHYQKDKEFVIHLESFVDSN